MNSMSKFTHVVFDYDGTLADSLEVTVAVISDIIEQRGYPAISPAMLQKFRLTPGMEGYTQLGVPLALLSEISRQVAAEVSLRINEIKPFPGIAELLKNLKESGFTTGILTSSNEENPRNFIQNNKLTPVDFIRVDETVFHKDIAMQTMLDEFQLSPTNVLYVGDEVRDIEAAKRINLPVAAVTWGYHDGSILAQSDPDVMIQTPQELLDFVRT